MLDQIVYAMGAPGQAVGEGFGMFLPLFLVFTSLSFLLKSLAKRRGRNQWAWFASGFIPWWNVLAVWWLSATPEAQIIEKLDAIIKELQYR